MRLNKVVLHLYNFQKEKGERSPLDDFIRDVNPIILSTCMRHIYVFDELQLKEYQDVFNRLLTYLQEPREHHFKIEYHYLTGVDAYSFLLHWSIGALNKNKPLDDHRVLDSIRKICLEYERSGSERKKKTYQINKKFLNYFLLDAKRMHQALLENLNTLKEEFYGQNHLIVEKFKQASHQCAQMRDNGFLDNLPTFNYSHFLLEKSEVLSKIKQNLEEVRDTLQAKLLGSQPKKINKSLNFFSNDLEVEKIKKEKIKNKIGSLNGLILSLPDNDSDNLPALPKEPEDVKTIEFRLIN